MKLKEFYKRHERILLLLLVAAYFGIFFPLINFLSRGRDAHVLLSSIDNQIPFIPWSMMVYLSAFFMPLLVYFFVKDMKLYHKMVISWMVVLSVAFFIYIIYPVEVILRPDMSATIFRPVFEWYFVITPPYNSLPSLHVAQPFLAAFFSFKADKKYWWMFVWAALITVSILFTKIHYFVDMIAGFALAVIVYLVVMRLMRDRR